jgi:hypothetical protein
VDKSAKPSINPSKAAEAPAIVVKKTAKTENIISELRSLKSSRDQASVRLDEYQTFSLKC